MHGPDGKDYKNKHIYKEIVKPEKIVMQHVTAPNFMTYVRFEEKGNKTLLTWRGVFESPEQLRKVIEVFHADEGLKQNVDKLEAYLANIKQLIITLFTINNEPFVIERTFNTPIAKLWKAITGKGEMKQWYLDLPEFKPEVGFEFQFTGGTEENKYLHFCKVIDVIMGKKIAYSWRYDGYEGNSIVSFELFEEGTKTRLKLTHEGLETFPVSNPDFAKKNFVAGWNEILDRSLKGFVEAAPGE